MSPYTVANSATGQLETENPSETDAEIRQAISSADAAFAALKHIDVPGTLPPAPAAPPVSIYVSLRETADPQVTDMLDKQGKAWESFAPPPYPPRERSRDTPAKRPPG